MQQQVISMPRNDATDIKDAREERWVYAGIRVLRGKAAQAWITDSGDGETVYFSPRGGPVVGEIYRASVTRQGESVTLHGTPRYAGDGRVNHERAADLLAGQQVAQALLAVARLERAAAKRNELDAALDPLRQIARRMKTSAEKDALVAYILRAILSAR
jgi:hypothetical protein